MVYQCDICLERFETLKDRTLCKTCQREVDVALFDSMPEMDDVQFESYLTRRGGIDE